MSLGQPCRRCGRDLRTKQVNNLLAKYCDYCGSAPFATNVKTGEGVRVDRLGVPHVSHSRPRLPVADMPDTVDSSSLVAASGSLSLTGAA